MSSCQSGSMGPCSDVSLSAVNNMLLEKGVTKPEMLDQFNTPQDGEPQLSMVDAAEEAAPKKKMGMFKKGFFKKWFGKKVKEENQLTSVMIDAKPEEDLRHLADDCTMYMDDEMFAQYQAEEAAAFEAEQNAQKKSWWKRIFSRKQKKQEEAPLSARDEDLPQGAEDIINENDFERFQREQREEFERQQNEASERRQKLGWFRKAANKIMRKKEEEPATEAPLLSRISTTVAEDMDDVANGGAALVEDDDVADKKKKGGKVKGFFKKVGGLFKRKAKKVEEPASEGVAETVVSDL